MEPLRIAFDTGPLHGHLTGIGLAVDALRRTLDGRDDVELLPYVLSFRARPEPPTVRLPLPAALAHRVWARTPHPRADRWLDGAQVVHGTNYVVPPARLPRLVSVYDCWFLRHPAQATGDVRRAGAVLTAAVRGGAVVHTSSQATADAVHELLPGADVHVVHLGALPLGDAPAEPPARELADHPYVLAIGTVERRKNLPRLVEAFGHVAADRPELRLVIAGGPGDDADATRAAVDALGPALAPKVVFTGRVDEAARTWLVRHAAVLAYPSLDEGFGFPLLDAMQAGVPIVGARVGSIPEVAGDAARLCDPLDVASIAGALDDVLSDPSLAERLVAAGRDRWPAFTWDRCADGIVDLYRRLAEGAAR